MQNRNEAAKPSADHYCFIEQWEVWKDEKAIHKAMQRMTANGAVDGRITAVDENHEPVGADVAAAGYWVEGWNEKQRPYPPFTAPMTYAEET